MDEDAQQDNKQSVANRVLLAFMEAICEDEALAEMAARLKPVLLDADTVSEASLRQAIFDVDS